jgi:chromosome segregation ATPase
MQEQQFRLIEQNAESLEKATQNMEQKVGQTENIIVQLGSTVDGMEQVNNGARSSLASLDQHLTALTNHNFNQEQQIILFSQSTESLKKINQTLDQAVKTFQDETAVIKPAAAIWSQLDEWLQSGRKVQDDLANMIGYLDDNARQLAVNSSLIPTQLTQYGEQLTSAISNIRRLEEDLRHFMDNLDRSFNALSENISAIQADSVELSRQFNIILDNEQKEVLQTQN